MKIATWNVNSIRIRLDRLLGVLERHQPDVLCLQELKAVEEQFPFEPVREAGYFAAVQGQRTYNGVAIVSRSEPQDVRKSFEDGVQDPQARFVSAVVDGVRVVSVYVPNGSVVGSDKWDYKLDWMRRLRSYLDANYNPSEPLALCGDFNVAPEDRDVANPDKWRSSVLCHEGGREALRAVCEWGLVDAFRLRRTEDGLYSWWDYRQLGFPKNDGLRLDHVFVTDELAGRSQAAEVDRQERKGKQPSDHAPVLVSFSD